VSAVASFVDGLKQSRSEGDAEAYSVLLNLAPEFLKDFTRRDGLAIERYYREAITRAGDVRADRKTAPIAGSLLLSENRKRLLDVLDYGSRQHSGAPRFLLWLVPQVPSWNATTLLDETVAGIRTRWSGQRADGQTDALKSICLTAPRPPRYVEKAFEIVATNDYRRFSGSARNPDRAAGGGRRNRARAHRVAARFCGSSRIRQLRRGGLGGGPSNMCWIISGAYVADESLYSEVAAALSGQKP